MNWTVAHGVYVKLKLFNKIRQFQAKRKLRRVFWRRFRATGQLRKVFWTSFSLLLKDTNKGLLNQGFPIDIFWNHTSTIKCDTTGVGKCESKIICSEIHVSFLLIFLVFLLTWSGVAKLSQRLCTGSSMNRILHLIPTSMMLLPNLFRSTFLENLEVSDWFRRWWTLF